MTPSFSLVLNGQMYTTEKILQLPADLPQKHPFSFPILQFCRQWLSGQEKFNVHTSGSTGKPKSITISRPQMQASARQTLQALGIPTGAKALLCINPDFIGGKMMLVRALEHQMQLIAVDASSNPLVQLPLQSTFDFTALVPLQLESILQNPHSRAVLQKIKAVIVGGAPVGLSLRQQLQTITSAVYSTYGMTETVSHIALQRLNGPEEEDFFTAFPEISLSQDERGCLVVAGEVSAGEKIVTNDVVELLSNNRFRWLGRADNIINSGGIKIQPELIEKLAETLLGQLGQQRNLFAWGLPDEQLGQRLVLFVEGTPLPQETEKAWKELLKEQLVKYKLPKAIYYQPEFCQTASGKIQKAATAALLNKT